jgi:two-component system, NarL family, nitrate/nitrite response regulator NarL
VTERIRILLADDHPPTRDDIRQALGRSPRLEVCSEVADAAAAVQEALATRPDICLLDIRMPGGGIAAAWEITARLPDTKVVMLTVSDSDADLFGALRAGASGYLLKDIDPDRLPHVILDVLAGEAALPRQLAARLVQAFRDRGPRRRAVVAGGPTAQLTSREWEVLDLLRQGRSTAAIAGELSVSQATVRSHVSSMLKKLRVPDRASALRLMDDE